MLVTMDNSTDNPMDQTTLSTLDLLESRLLRIEHLLYGQTASPSHTQDQTATQKLAELEQRFSALLSNPDFRVYREMIKIYKKQPSWFHSPAPSDLPSQLSIEAIRSIVLASAASYQATFSALTAVRDSPIPDPAESTALIGLGERMRAIEATQIAQAAEIAELRKRSERVVRQWYENGVLNNSRTIADLEGRIERAERQVRRAEREMEEEDGL